MNEKLFEQMCQELVEDYVLDEDGNKVGVVLDIDVFQDLLDELHDLSLKLMNGVALKNPDATEEELIDFCCGQEHDEDEEEDDDFGQEEEN